MVTKVEKTVVRVSEGTSTLKNVRLLFVRFRSIRHSRRRSRTHRKNVLMLNEIFRQIPPIVLAVFNSNHLVSLDLLCLPAVGINCSTEGFHTSWPWQRGEKTNWETVLKREDAIPLQKTRKSKLNRGKATDFGFELHGTVPLTDHPLAFRCTNGPSNIFPNERKGLVTSFRVGGEWGLLQ